MIMNNAVKHIRNFKYDMSSLHKMKALVAKAAVYEIALISFCITILIIISRIQGL